MFETQFVGKCKNFLLVADEDDVGQFVGQSTVGGGQCTFLQALRQHDTLLVLLSAEDDLVH